MHAILFRTHNKKCLPTISDGNKKTFDYISGSVAMLLDIKI